MYMSDLTGGRKGLLSEGGRGVSPNEEPTAYVT